MRTYARIFVAEMAGLAFEVVQPIVPVVRSLMRIGSKHGAQ